MCTIVPLSTTSPRKAQSFHMKVHFDPVACHWEWCTGVANLGHHARHHVIEIAAVKRPTAGIVGIKGDGDAAHRWHRTVSRTAPDAS